MVATAEDTSDITRAILSVTLMSEVVTSAFDTARFKVTVVLRVAVALTVGALGNISFVVRFQPTTLSYIAEDRTIRI
jgi:hypothetical protein